jgi:hypothetical protein
MLLKVSLQLEVESEEKTTKEDSQYYFFVEIS